MFLVMGEQDLPWCLSIRIDMTPSFFFNPKGKCLCISEEISSEAIDPRALCSNYFSCSQCAHTQKEA